jgi:hypothetical protein
VKWPELALNYVEWRARVDKMINSDASQKNKTFIAGCIGRGGYSAMKSVCYSTSEFRAVLNFAPCNAYNEMMKHETSATAFTGITGAIQS